MAGQVIASAAEPAELGVRPTSAGRVPVSWSAVLERLKRRPEGKLKGRGVEFGAHDLPIPGIRPIYADRYAEFAGQPCRVDVMAAADALPFRAGSLDYFAASHVLEHLGNPIRALEEWTRVLKPGGRLYLVGRTGGTPSTGRGDRRRWRTCSRITTGERRTTMPRTSKSTPRCAS